MIKNGKIYTSRQQIYINDLIHRELNYPIKYYSTDIILVNKKL